jgi:26S proteasome regulatory subunit N3
MTTCHCALCAILNYITISPNYCATPIIAMNCVAIKYHSPDRADPTALDIRSNFTLLDRAVAQFDSRFTLRALRSISTLRKKLTDRVLCSVIVLTYTPSNPTARVLIEATGLEGEEIQAVVGQYKEEIQANKGNTKEPLPEIDVYIAILIQVRSAKS